MTTKQLDNLIQEIRKEHQLATDQEEKECWAALAVALKEIAIRELIQSIILS